MTITALVQELQSAMWMPDCPTDVAETLVQRVWRNVLMRVHASTGTQTVLLVAGTQEYTLTECFHISQAYYQPSSDKNAAWPLCATSIEAMRSEDRYMRINPQRSQPREFYTVSTGPLTKIGLYPIPDTTSGGGYPSILVYGTFYATLTDVPDCLLSPNVLLAGMALEWAKRTQPDKAKYWQEMYNQEIDMNVLFVEGKQEETNFSLRGPGYYPTRVV
jgi:hypothetical protein